MTDLDHLPEYAYAVSPNTGKPVVIYRGEEGLFPTPRRLGVDPHDYCEELNRTAGVTPEEAAAMLKACLSGWTVIDIPAPRTAQIFYFNDYRKVA